MFETGIGIKNPLFFIGVIENNVDPRLEGRVQVRAFGIHGTNKEIPRESLPWAVVAQGNYDANNIPRINAWVFGVFLDGRDAQTPMVLGLIPTQFADPVDPDKTGWGWIPDKDGELLARGSDPENFGQPQQSRLLRGEDIQQTHVLQHEAGRTLNVKTAAGDTWDEPGSAFNTQYPHNKVIETAYHSIELDDTPGGERITIFHKSGSYVQIDSRGTVTEKSTGDKFEVIDRKQHVVVSGSSTVTINGNSYVYVKGNKIEEIEGDLQTKVHGNHLLSVGGQSTINASEQVQVRAADVRIEANVGTMSINAAKELNISSGGFEGIVPKYGAISIKAEKIMVDATDKLHLRGNTQVNIQSVAEMNLSAVTINQLSANWAAHSSLTTRISSALNADISAGVDLTIGGTVVTNISSAFVNIGEFVNLAPTTPIFPPVPASLTVVPKFLIPPVLQKPFIPQSPYPELAFRADKVQAPEPVAKSTSIVPSIEPGSMGSSGFSANDHGGEDCNNPALIVRIPGAPSVPTPSAQGALGPLLDYIGVRESRGYDDISGLVSKSRYPSKKITQMTMREILDWQESIDKFQISEAVGRYMFMEDTLRGYDNDKRGGSESNSLYVKAGLSSGSLFSPENQDKMAGVLIQAAGLNKFLSGEISRETFANKLANVWAALPLVSGPNAGKSAYEGDKAGNRVSTITTIQSYLDVLDKVKAGYAVNNGGKK
jgi:hypothetical protein